MSNARRRRERRLRSWWRHEAQSVAAALTAARHHSAGPRGTRPAPLPVVAGSQGVWPGAPRQPGSVVPSVVPPALAAPAVETVDAAGLSFLLAQTLAAQQQEEVEAKEQAAVAELEEKVAAAEDWLLRELEQDWAEAVRVTTQSWPTLSRVEQLAIVWFLAKDKVRKRELKRKKKEEEAELLFMTSLSVLFRLVGCFCGFFNLAVTFLLLGLPEEYNT